MFQSKQYGLLVLHTIVAAIVVMMPIDFAAIIVNMLTIVTVDTVVMIIALTILRVIGMIVMTMMMMMIGANEW